MAALSIKDLTAIAKKTKESMQISAQGPHTKITVHMGTCGIAAGAQKVMDSFKEVLEIVDKKDVILTYSGCAGLCSNEPMVTIERYGEKPIKYINITPKIAREIMKQHVQKGNPLKEYIIAKGYENIV